MNFKELMISPHGATEYGQFTLPATTEEMQQQGELF
jgi:hypothetical protein